MNQLIKTTISTLSLAAVMAASLASQATMFPTKRLVGWADLPAPNMASYLDIQEIPGCKKALTYCKYPANLPLRPQAYKPYAGGTAYDARHRSVWVSDGKVLAERYIRGCKSRCKPFKAIQINPKAYVSGLAISQKKPRLFQLSTTEYYWEIVTYDLKGCPKPIAKCFYKFPTSGGMVRPVAGGLAYDEINDRLYVSISFRTATGAYANMAMVTTGSTPCKPLCNIKIMPSSSKLVTGLAWDNCKRALYATDGAITQPHYFTQSNYCQPKIGPACKKQTTPTWRGLALIPGARQFNRGKSCTKAPCQTCNTMWAGTTGGDPVFGNQNFGFRLSNAPTGGYGLFILRYGPLSPTGWPIACGNLYTTSGPFLAINFQALGGAGSCGGSGLVPFPLPSSPMLAKVLCDKPLSAQWLVFCKSVSSFGWGGVSNAFQFQISN
jgi:hypothetical protein